MPRLVVTLGLQEAEGTNFHSMDQSVVKFRPLPSAKFINTIKMYNATLTLLVPPFSVFSLPGAGKGRLGGILSINVIIIMRLLINKTSMGDLTI